MAKATHRFHGDVTRFDVVADLVAETFGKRIQYIADVAGGQGMLSKVLRKKYNYEAEVIDPRGWVLNGVPSRQAEYSADMASYYDLIIGLHPDQATRAIAESALIRPTILIPCCNFWDRTQVLGSIPLIEAIEEFYTQNAVTFERREIEIKRPKNLALITY